MMEFSALKGSPAFSSFPLLQHHTLDDPIELPSTEETFVLPSRILEDAVLLGNIIDRQVVPYLPAILASVVPERLVPMRTCGDGNCLLNALSTAMWGLEKYHKLLRQQLIAELSNNIDWYKTTSKHRDPEEWDAAVEMAKKEGSFLEFIHIFAIANVLQRPIIIYASDSDRETFGDGEGGVTACFVPTRHRDGCVNKRPLLISWGNEHRNHYIPLVPVENQDVPYLLVGTAFQQTLEDRDVSLYLDHTATPKQPSLVEVLRRQIKQLIDPDYHIPIHFQGNIYTLRLRDDDNAFTRTKDFMSTTGIPEEYRMKILQEIVTVTGEKPADIKAKAKAPTTNRPRGGSIPIMRYFTFNDAQAIDKALQKVLQFNFEAEEFLQLSETDIKLLKTMVGKMKETDVGSVVFQDEEIEVVTRLLEWPVTKVFPAFDFARMLLLFPESAQYLCNHMKSALDDRNLLSLCVEKIRESETPAAPAYMLFLRILSNLFHTECGRQTAEEYARVILCFVDECLQLPQYQKLLYPACYKLLANLALLSGKSCTMPLTFKLQLLLLLFELLSDHADEEMYCAALDALGTLLYFDPKICEYLLDRMDIISPLRKLSHHPQSPVVIERSQLILEMLLASP